MECEKVSSAMCTLVDFLRLGKHLLLIGRATEQRRNVDSRPKEDRESNEKHERSEACEECRYTSNKICQIGFLKIKNCKASYHIHQQVQPVPACSCHRCRAWP